MINEINILWWWKIGTWLIIKLAKEKPNIIFNLITRNKLKFENTEINYIKNIRLYDYNDNIKENLLCFYCISVDEQKIISEYWFKNIDRNIILKQNLKIAYDILPFLKQISPKNLFIITNPVETISIFFSNKLQNTKVFWLWLELDAKRIKDVLSLFFDLDISEDIFVLWNHSISPIPILSNTFIYSNLKELTINKILQNIKKWKKYSYLKTDIDFYEEFYKYIYLNCLDIWFNDIVPIQRIYKIIDFLNGLLVKSEFINNKPPVEYPIYSLFNTILKILDFKESIINISYLSDKKIFTWWLLKFDNIWNIKILNIKVSVIEKELINTWNFKI
jgi:hypothetical protein